MMTIIGLTINLDGNLLLNNSDSLNLSNSLLLLLLLVIGGIETEIISESDPRKEPEKVALATTGNGDGCSAAILL